MFHDIDVACRAAACLTHADGRKRFVYQNGNGPTVTIERPCHPHTEIWRSAEIHTLIMGTSIRPCPALHPSALYGIVFQEGGRSWVRDWHGKNHLVFLRDAGAAGLISLPDETPAFMPGGDIVYLSAGFVVQVTQLFQVGADFFSLLEDGDGNEFLVWGRVQ